MADQDQAVKQIDSVTDYVEEKEDNNLQSGLTSLVSSSTTIRSVSTIYLSCLVLDLF